MTPRPPSPPSLDRLVGKLVEYGVYLPVGLAERARRELPSVAEQGRQTVQQRVMIARFIGAVVAQQARHRVEDLLGGSNRGTPTTATAPSAPTPPADAATATASREAAPEPAKSGAASPASDELPITGYESLSASQVVPMLAHLTPVELESIEQFERTHRHRRTVLNRIEQLRKR